MHATAIHADQLDSLLLEALEAELGAIAVYDAAVRCAVHADWRSEWTECLLQAESHRDDLLRALDHAGIDPGLAVPGRATVAQVSQALLRSIESRVDQGDRADAQNMALECARLMKRRDRIDWELLAMAVDVANDDVIEDDYEIAPVGLAPPPQLETMVPFSSPSRRTRISSQTAAAA